MKNLFEEINSYLLEIRIQKKITNFFSMSKYLACKFGVRVIVCPIHCSLIVHRTWNRWMAFYFFLPMVTKWHCTPTSMRKSEHWQYWISITGRRYFSLENITPKCTRLNRHTNAIKAFYIEIPTVKCHTMLAVRDAI